MNGVSGKDSLVGINAARSSEAIPLKSVPTLCQFYTAHYGRGFFFFLGVDGGGALRLPLAPSAITKPGIRQTSRKREGGREEGGRGKKKNPPNIHTSRKKEERERSAALAPGLAPRTSNACLICCAEPPHLALASQSSLRCLPAWPSPSGRPFDGKPRTSLRLVHSTPNYIFGLTKLPCHAGPHASTAPRTGKPRAALSHVRRGARPAGAEG